MDDMMTNAGWVAYPLLLSAIAAGGAGLLALVLSGAKLLRPALVIAGVAVGLAFVGVFAGRAGSHDSMRRSYRAVAHALPEDREPILAGAERESRSSMTLGLLSLPGGLLGAVAVGLAFARTGSSR